MTANQVIARLRISRSLLNSLIAKGTLRGVKHGRQWRFEERDVRACVVEQAPVPPRYWGGYRQARLSRDPDISTRKPLRF